MRRKKVWYCCKCWDAGEHAVYYKALALEASRDDVVQFLRKHPEILSMRAAETKREAEEAAHQMNLLEVGRK